MKQKYVLKDVQDRLYFKNVSYEDRILTFKIRVQLSLALKKIAEETFQFVSNLCFTFFIKY